MIFDNLTAVPKKEFPTWIKRVPGRNAGGRAGVTVVFPHAGGAAVGYRKLATALAAAGDTYIVQYPQRAERLREPAAETVQDLARGLFVAGPWRQMAPLRLFGHSMGAVVAFEFARIAESRGAAVERLWASAASAPSAVADMPELPTSHDDLWSISSSSVEQMPICLPTKSSPSCWSPRYGPIMRRSIAIPAARELTSLPTFPCWEPAATYVSMPRNLHSGRSTPPARSICPGTTADTSSSTITSTRVAAQVNAGG